MFYSSDIDIPSNRFPNLDKTTIQPGKGAAIPNKKKNHLDSG